MVAETASCAASPISSQLKQQATSSIKARVRYVKPPPPGKVLQSHVYEQTADRSNSDNLVHVPTEVNISDIRGLQNQTFDLLVNGFSLVKFNVPIDIDWETDDEVSKLMPLMLPSAACLGNVQCTAHTREFKSWLTQIA